MLLGSLDLGEIFDIKAGLSLLWLNRHAFSVTSIQYFLFHLALLVKLLHVIFVENLSARKITQYDKIFISNLNIIVKNKKIK